MEETNYQSSFRRKITREVIAVLCVLLLRPVDGRLFAQSEGAKNPDQSKQEKAPDISPDQLDSLVAPIALYPDPLLAQTLAASTYPLEIIQLHQWLAKHPELKGKEKELAAAVAKEPWDPSVQAMAALPDVVKRLSDDIQWTTDLGNAFLAQQSGVMEAVQRMRKKAKDKGTLTSNEQQKVETKVVESKTVIVVEQANPEVIYVPSYNPVVVYGAPVYAYPPIYYPPAGYYAAGMAISFGVGVAMGAMWSGGWGWGAGWGNNNVQINNFNNFNRNVNANRNVNRNTGANGNRNWSHNPQHRGGAPYRDRATANQYGGTARGDSAANRQANARQQTNRQSGSASGARTNAAGSTASRTSGARANSTGTRANSTATRGSSGSSGGSRSAFGGSGSYNGSSARSASSRGSSSMGGRSMGGRGGGGGRGRR